MGDRHQMHVEVTNSHELLFVCPDCSRRLVIRAGADLIVIDRGDEAASHWGDLGGAHINTIHVGGDG